MVAHRNCAKAMNPAMDFRGAECSRSPASAYFRELHPAIPEERIEATKDPLKYSCRLWRWSRRERSADIPSDLGQVDNAGPAPKSTQSSLSTYLWRFNEKRRLHYKIRLKPTRRLFIS